MSSPVGVGVIGAGTISDTYLENLSNFADTEVLAIGDIVTDAAKEKAVKYEIPSAGDVAIVLDHPDIEIVVNLTIPAAHADIATQAIATGKHVWNENLSPSIALAAEACSATLKRLGYLLAAHRIRSWELVSSGLPANRAGPDRDAAHGSCATAVARTRASGIPIPRFCTRPVQVRSSTLGLTTSLPSCRSSAQSRRWLPSGPRPGSGG